MQQWFHVWRMPVLDYCKIYGYPTYIVDQPRSNASDIHLKAETKAQIHHQNRGNLGHQQFHAFRFLN